MSWMKRLGAGAVGLTLLLVVPGCEGTGTDDGDSEAMEEESGEELSVQVTAGTQVKTTTSVNFRSGPSTGYKVLKVLPKGALLTLVSGTPTKGFYQAQHDGAEGWLSGKYIAVVSTKPAPTPAPSDPSAACEGVDLTDFRPPTSCNGPGGNTSKQLPGNGVYSTSWFGCYFDASGKLKTDPYDNCEFACGAKGYCDKQGPACQASLKWFAADADRYGCGTKIRVTNCKNGKSVVLATLDRGPNCKTIEQKHDAPVLDMSHDAMGHLFDGKFYGGGDYKSVVVEVVDPSTPLGPS
jgi:hypothetical protein